MYGLVLLGNLWSVAPLNLMNDFFHGVSLAGNINGRANSYGV